MEFLRVGIEYYLSVINFYDWSKHRHTMRKFLQFNSKLLIINFIRTIVHCNSVFTSSLVFLRPHLFQLLVLTVNQLVYIIQKIWRFGFKIVFHKKFRKHARTTLTRTAKWHNMIIDISDSCNFLVCHYNTQQRTVVNFYYRVVNTTRRKYNITRLSSLDSLIPLFANNKFSFFV